jgi:hypothetical protein
MSDKKVKTAFLVVALENGTYTAYTDMHGDFEVEHTATILDLKNASREIYESILREDTVQAVFARLMPPQAPETQEVKPSDE